MQWGASLDETLEDKVRVTIIATGFEVSNIPGLDDAVDKKTVEEAIELHYGDTKMPEKEDVLEDIPAATIDIPVHVVNRPVAHESGDILIDLDDDIVETKPTQDTPTNFGSFAGWMRGRK